MTRCAVILGLQTHRVIALCARWILLHSGSNRLVEIHTHKSFVSQFGTANRKSRIQPEGLQREMPSEPSDIFRSLFSSCDLLSVCLAGNHQAKVLLLHCHFGSSGPIRDCIRTPIRTAVFVRYWLYPSGHVQAAPFLAASSELVKPRRALVRKS